MKKSISCTVAALTAITAVAGDNLGIDKKYGSFSGRVQTLSMWRDYERINNSEYSHTLGIQLNYTSPEVAGFSVAGTYNGVGVLDASNIHSANPGQSLLANGRVDQLNQGYLQYRLVGAGASNTTFSVGRQAQKGEVFRYVEARHTQRSLEGVFIETKDIPNTRIQVGHSWKLANIYGQEGNDGLSWEFDNYSDVFNYRSTATTKSNTDGITWIEAGYTGCENLDIAVFGSLAWDVAHLIGTRAKFSITESTAIEGSYRNEQDLGKGVDHNADCFSLALIQKIGALTLEGGYFGVHGDDLRFEENTTGINHAVGYSLMIDTDHFRGGADSAYAKAVAKINKTVLYGLFIATWQKQQSFNHAQELDLVVKQPINKCLSVALKGGISNRQMNTGSDVTQTDARIFLTYKF